MNINNYHLHKFLRYILCNATWTPASSIDMYIRSGTNTDFEALYNTDCTYL